MSMAVRDGFIWLDGELVPWQVGMGQIIFANRRQMRLVDLLLGIGQLHVEDMRTVEKPVGVILQAKHCRPAIRFVGPHAFEHAHAIMQSVRQYVDLGDRNTSELQSQ